jgi:hypothetical protein
MMLKSFSRIIYFLMLVAFLFAFLTGCSNAIVDPGDSANMQEAPNQSLASEPPPPSPPPGGPG